MMDTHTSMCSLLTDAAVAGLIAAALCSKSAYAATTWETRVEKDQFSDQVYTGTQSYASEGINKYGGRPGMIILCAPGGSPNLSMVIEWGQYVGDKFVYVSTRLDNREARHSKWWASEGATHYVEIGEDKNDLRAFIDQLKAGRRLLVRVEPESGDWITATFDLEGFTKAVQPVIAACP
jgi:hypothetical protein